MNYILFDDYHRKDLLPLTFTRPTADIRVGILTIREKWEFFLKEKTSSLTETYLSAKFPLVEKPSNMLINGTIIPNAELISKIKSIEPGQALIKGDCIIAQHITADELSGASSKQSTTQEIQCEVAYTKINYPWEIFSKNDEQIRADFELLTKGRKSMEISDTNLIAGEENIFLEEGAIIEFATINAEKGPVYIGKDAEVMEGCLIRGPFALLDDSTLKMGAKIYGATTIGPHCKVGGEVSNSVFFGYSNKAHEGFIGNSVIAEWCNLGADTNASNLKNTYESVKLWNYNDEAFINTGLQFCGLVMGDHSKCGINTMFNTGTVVGVFANIFGAGYPRQFIPSFSWGGASGFKTYDLKKAFKVASEVFKRRNLEFNDVEQNILEEIYNISFHYRQM